MAVNTVLGEVSPASLGSTLMHEHLFINMKKEYREYGFRGDMSSVVDDVGAFRGVGGGTIVDVTTAEISAGTFAGLDHRGAAARSYQKSEGARSTSNIEMLQEVSRRTGVHIVVGTGHYRDPYLDKTWFDESSADEIGELMARDIVEGIPGTSARAGIIGEIGCDKWFLSAAEERSFRAAARAQLKTGVPLSTHAAFWPTGPLQVDLLTSEGIAPEHIIVGHVDSVPDEDYAVTVARMGVWVQLDSFFACFTNGTLHADQLDHRIATILRLIRAGYLEKILLSHDIYLSHHSKKSGGSGLDFIGTVVRSRLLAEGVSAAEFDLMTIDNPRRTFDQ